MLLDYLEKLFQWALKSRMTQRIEMTDLLVQRDVFTIVSLIVYLDYRKTVQVWKRSGHV